ncbi:MAG: ABC transporter substrate-binding protein [Candidatus Thermofonsia Clade 1 bacterium]|jgi:sn-glycerol 3-phosphate transport system substrate-binding protein|uniref:ABC transporter substrate-binding protein n=1 Tax=Candidatus Thermofonsia Clade 1 bacterium TaxID=2364210 RepID=A0A2M8PB92_9CHLR|nr:MAG: ABC transporter substrate-binding protein [Candidatus Thermofonsia Clade 1 bacterium]RMF53083.1 MAG: ABC transporter substrate-binding protein [Chloroflexota bacterium]
MLKRAVILAAILAVLGLSAANTRTEAQSVVEIDFYYPTAVGGPITQILDEYAAQFNAANPDIKVNAIYAGGYDEIYKAVQTQISGGGTGPDVAIFLAVDLFSLIENDFIVPLTDFIEKTEGAKEALADFFPAFMLNTLDENGVVWGIPFQRSTPVMYYNKDLFREVGLDPEVAPKTWQDMLEAAKKLTKPDGSRWGLMIPSDGFPYWLFQGFAISNGKNLVEESPTEVYFNTPSTVEALEFFAALSRVHKVMPEGIIKWGDTPTAFTSGQAAIIYHTTGSLTNILRNANFEVGVGFLPQGKAGYGAPTGGGNLHILKTSSPAEQAAAWRWIQFLSSPEIQADWGVKTGYVAARQSAWELEPLKSLVREKPQYAVARDQLPFAQKELSTYRGLDVRQIFGKAVQAVITGEKDAKTALDEAQAAADQLLAPYRQ